MKSKFMLIIAISLLFTSLVIKANEDQTNESLKTKSTNIVTDNLLGAWKIYNTSTHKHENGVIAVFKSKKSKDNYEIFVSEGPGHSDSSYSCEAIVAGSGKYEYIKCDSKITVGLIINDTASICNDLINDSKVMGRGHILSYSDSVFAKTKYDFSICYTIYEDTGPGPGGGTAGKP